jgi:hypothetical protein
MGKITLCSTDEVNLASFTNAALARGFDISYRPPRKGRGKNADRALVIDGDSWCADRRDLKRLMNKLQKHRPDQLVALFSYQRSDEDLALLRAAGILAYNRPAVDELLAEMAAILNAPQPAPAPPVATTPSLVSVI